MSSESGGSTKESSNSEKVERQIRKAITYSDEKLLKTALKAYKKEKLEINDAYVLHHAVRLGKLKVSYLIFIVNYV